MINEEDKDNLDLAQPTGMPPTQHGESEPRETRKANWREVFQTRFRQVRRQRRPAGGRQELGRDKSKAFFLLIGAAVALLLLVFGIFSTPLKHTPLPGEMRHGQASLGRNTPGYYNPAVSRSRNQISLIVGNEGTACQSLEIGTAPTIATVAA